MSEDLGIKFANITLVVLGQKMWIEKQNTTIVDGGGKTADFQAGIAQIKETTSHHERDKRGCGDPHPRRDRSAG